MKELTDETINKKKKGSDGFSESKNEPEYPSGLTVDKFYADDRLILRK
jgi:hypothetical protein